MNNPFEVEISSGEDYTKRQIKKEKDKETLPIMQPVYPKEIIVDSNKYKLLKFFVIIFFLASLFLGYSFLNLAKDGAFKSTINQDVQLQPNITAFSNISNDYSFTPSTLNNFTNNYTIINKIECPNISCNC